MALTLDDGFSYCAKHNEIFSTDAGEHCSGCRRLDFARLEKAPGAGFAFFHRPPREDYVRVTCQWQGYTIEPGLEYRDDDSFNDIAGALKNIAQTQCDVPDRFSDAMMIARIVGACIAAVWSDRAYFVEVWQEGREGFAQVFQPFGVPRNR